jgi:uncharacterized membrane protein YkoI
MKKLITISAMIAIGACLATAQKKLTLAKLPPAVQAAVQAEAKGAEIQSITKETERGVTQYEIETVLNGKHRDFEVDTKGKVLVVEEETNIDSLPAAARAGILRKVGDGKLGMVELFERGGDTMYEAAYTTKTGKKQEVLVRADGSETKD